MNLAIPLKTDEKFQSLVGIQLIYFSYLSPMIHDHEHSHHCIDFGQFYAKVDPTRVVENISECDKHALRWIIICSHPNCCNLSFFEIIA